MLPFILQITGYKYYRDGFKHMKKRSHTALPKTPKPAAKPHPVGQTKKRNTKSSHDNSPKPKKKKVEDYLIIDGTVYSADTKTQRYEVDQFVRRIRSEAKLQIPKCPHKIMEDQHSDRKRSPEQSTQIISMEDYVNGLSRTQKIKLLEQLEKEMLSNPEIYPQQTQEVHQIIDTRPEANQIEEEQDRMGLLNQKLESVKEQLQVKKRNKMQQINSLFNGHKIDEHEFRSRVRMVNKIMDRNTKIIHCTRNLFETILNSSYEHEFLKNKEIDIAMKELDSFSEIESSSSPTKEHHRVDSEGSIQSEPEFDKLQFKVDPIDEKKVSVDEPLLISPDKNEADLDLQKFQCAEENLTKKLKIPLLMTKEKLEEIQKDEKIKAFQKMKIEIDKKISFQMSEMENEDVPEHFTTLADINAYIVGLYEYITRCDLDRIVQRLNFPYGKSVRDKLYLLQQSGQVDQNQYYPVLDESYFNQYNKEVALSIRMIPENQKIHHKAVFDCFNTYLNAYRPYYELEGEVYPWSISEKGITFYEINDENIEEVFEKTKIKVLEFASTLCGIIPHAIEINQSPQLVKQKNEELALKEERLAIAEEFSKWDIKVINYDVMVRFLLAEEVLEREIMSAIADFS